MRMEEMRVCLLENTKKKVFSFAVLRFWFLVFCASHPLSPPSYLLEPPLSAVSYSLIPFFFGFLLYQLHFHEFSSLFSSLLTIPFLHWILSVMIRFSTHTLILFLHGELTYIRRWFCSGRLSIPLLAVPSLVLDGGSFFSSTQKLDMFLSLFVE